ncbi:NACHT and WD repeat domain-containing protein [Streptomyces sp. NPDC005209]|uniref:NACHT and WD repeat domain-containing protein n=1 Tax=Streptomyces sp. NPDC005209 TaxID=3156715 RepID=UPI00339DB00B
MNTQADVDLSGIARRRLVVVAVDGYRDEREGFRDAIAEQVTRITTWLADPALGEDRRFEVVPVEEPLNTVGDLRDFLRKVKLSEAGYEDAIVVYITGHGLCRQAGRHYLTVPKTHPERLLSTAFPTSELITAVLDSEAEHILVLVDSCHSGVLRAELSTLLQDLSKERRRHVGIAVVTAGDHEDQPQVGSFTRRVALAWERMNDESAGYTSSHLSFAEWEQLLHEVGLADGVEKDLIDAEWIMPHSRRHQLSACLPNPRYKASGTAVDPALQQLVLEHGDLEFWRERASGRVSGDDAGWYFSGRTKPMRRLVDFLRDGEGVLIVTGAAGSGKSALLARLVTLTAPAFVEDESYAALIARVPREIRPVPGSVDAAVLARNKSSRALVDDLLTALGGTPAAKGTPLQALFQRTAERVAELSRPVTVIIDALDEAEDPLACVNDVILPLARLTASIGETTVRLLLGIRSSPKTSYSSGGDLRDERADDLLQRLTAALKVEGAVPEPLRTDGPDCEADIAAYAVALLSGPEDSPYKDADDEAVEETARVIAKAVAPSFLDAQIATDQLRTAETRQDLTEEGWLHRIADGTSTLLREDVRSVAAATGVPANLLVAALRATALAQGAGLPWGEVWPAVTAALAANPHSPADLERAPTAPGGEAVETADRADHAVRTLRSSRLTGYLATASEDGRTVYRPVHQRLTDLLQVGHEWVLGASDTTPLHAPLLTTGNAAELAAAHATVTGVLARLVRRAHPHLAHPYIRRHYLYHAQAGDLLTDRHVPVELLAQETSGTLRARLSLPLPTGDPDRGALTAAALIEPYLDDSTDPRSRSESMHFLQRVRGETRNAADEQRVLAFHWGRWAAQVNVLAPAQKLTRALCAIPTLDQRWLVAAADVSRGVRVWDASTGLPTADLATDGPVFRLRTVRATGGRTFLITLTPDRVEIHDPVSGQLVAQLVVAWARDVHVLEDGPSLWKLFILTQSGSMVWRPRSGQTTPARDVPSYEPKDPLQSAVVRRASGHALVALAGSTGIRLWDPFSGLTADAPFGPRNREVRLAPLSRPGQDDLLVVQTRGASTQIWEPFTASQTASVRETGHSLIQIPGSTDFAYATGCDIVVRDTELNEVQRIAADVSRINELTALTGPAGPRVVSAAPQGIRIWDLALAGRTSGDDLPDTPYPAPAPRGFFLHTWPLRRMVYPGPDGPVDCIVVGTREGLDVHDATTGRLLKQIPISTAPVTVVRALPSPSRAAYVAVAGTSASVWDLVSGQSVASPDPASLPFFSSRTCVTVTGDGLPVFVTASGRGELSSTTVDPKSGETLTHVAQTDFGHGEAPVLIPVPAAHTVTGPAIVVARGRAIELVDAVTGHGLGLWVRGKPATPYRVGCTVPWPDGLHIAVANDREIQVWDLTGRTQVAAWPAHGTLAMTGLNLADGRTLLVSSSSSGVRIWDSTTGELLHTLLTGAPVHAVISGPSAKGPVLHLYGPAGLVALSVDPLLL